VIAGQVQFCQDVGDNILRATGDRLVQLRHQLAGWNAPVLLTQAGLQAEIELASTHGLGEEVGYAAFAGDTLFRGEREKHVCESIGELNSVTQGRELVPSDFHRDLNSCLPAPPLYVEDTSLGVWFSFHRFWSEEQGDTIGWGFVSHRQTF